MKNMSRMRPTSMGHGMKTSKTKKKKGMNPRNKVLAGSMAYGTKVKPKGPASMMRGSQVLKKPGHGKKVSAPRGRY